jgi:DNA polymerase III subunit beta
MFNATQEKLPQVVSNAVSFSVPTSLMRSVIGQAASVAPSRTPLPALEHLLIETKTGAMKVVASDLAVNINRTFAADVSGEGAFCIPAAQFSRWLQVVSGDVVTGSVPADGGEIVLRCGPARIRLPLLPADDFPTFNSDTKAPLAKVSADLFRSAVRAVVAPQSVRTDDPSRPALAGVRVRMVEGNLEMLGGDRYCIVRALVQATPAPEAPPADYLVGMRELGRTASLISGDDVRMVVRGEDLRLVQENGWTGAAMLDAEYPSVDHILSRKTAAFAEVSRTDLASALEVALVAHTGAEIGWVRLSAENGSVGVLLSTGPSDSCTAIAAESTSGTFSMDVNGQALHSLLKRLPGGLVRIGGSTNGQPIKIETLDGDVETVAIFATKVAEPAEA